jgi:hypothetical protein
MKRTALIVSLTILFGLNLHAKEHKLKFHLKFGPLKGGEAEMTVYDTVFNGKPAIHYHVLGRTTGLAEKLYGVYDILESTVDAKTHLPLKTIRNVKEGGYMRYEETFFFQEQDSVYSQRRGGRKVPHNLLDLVSVFFYFVNTYPVETMQPGDGATYTTINAGQISDVTVKFLREEVIETDIGKVDCYVLKPIVDKGKVLRRSDGVLFYISKAQKLPFYITFDMPVGSLDAVIQSYELNGVKQIRK